MSNTGMPKKTLFNISSPTICKTYESFMQKLEAKKYLKKNSKFDYNMLNQSSSNRRQACERLIDIRKTYNSEFAELFEVEEEWKTVSDQLKISPSEISKLEKRWLLLFSRTERAKTDHSWNRNEWAQESAVEEYIVSTSINNDYSSKKSYYCGLENNFHVKSLKEKYLQMPQYNLQIKEATLCSLPRSTESSYSLTTKGPASTKRV